MYVIFLHTCSSPTLRPLQVPTLTPRTVTPTASSHPLPVIIQRPQDLDFIYSPPPPLFQILLAPAPSQPTACPLPPVSDLSGFQDLAVPVYTLIACVGSFHPQSSDSVALLVKFDLNVTESSHSPYASPIPGDSLKARNYSQASTKPHPLTIHSLESATFQSKIRVEPGSAF